jgi:hypothetical protein
MPAGRRYDTTPPREIIAYTSFAGGEFGTKSGFQAPPHSFSGKNMIVYENGALGPRGGLVDLAPTGTVAGVVKGFGWQDTTGKDVWYAQGTAIRRFSGSATGSAVVTYTGAMSTTPVTFALDEWYDAGSITYVTNFDAGQTYQLNHLTDTLTTLTGAPGGRCMFLHNDLMFVAATGTGLGAGNRLRYSASGNYNSWPAGNFLDVGDGWQIVKVWLQRTSVLIVKQDGSWWRLTGTPAQSASGALGTVTLRRVYGGGSQPPVAQVSGPQETFAGYELENGNIMYIPSSRDYPAVFTGATTTHHKWLNWLNRTNTLDTSSIFPPTMTMRKWNFYDEVAVLSGITATGATNRFMLYHESAWTFHTFEKNVGWLATAGRDRAYFTDGGAVAVAPKFYVLKSYLNRPGKVGGTFDESPGDASATAFDAFFTLPIWTAPSNSEVIVRAIDIDIQKFNPNGGQTNHFDLAVTAIRLYDSGSSVASATRTFDEASSSGSDAGVRHRVRLTFGDQGLGAGFQLAFTNIRGVAFERITVFGDVLPAREP